MIQGGLAENGQELTIDPHMLRAGHGTVLKFVNPVDVAEIVPQSRRNRRHGRRAQGTRFLADVRLENVDLPGVGKDLPPEFAAAASGFNREKRFTFPFVFDRHPPGCPIQYLQ